MYAACMLHLMTKRCLTVSIFFVRKNRLPLFSEKNGSGKSVFLKTIAGLIVASGGTITIDGTSPVDIINRKDESAGKPLPVVSYVFQKGGLFDSMNVYDNIAFGMRRIGKTEEYISHAITEILNKVGLPGSELKAPSELSGGMQKRVGLARALCMSPTVILYDDPSAGLDPVLTDAIADLLLDIQETFSATSLVVTHDLAFAEKNRG